VTRHLSDVREAKTSLVQCRVTVSHFITILVNCRDLQLATL